jgi:hypothetical protein
LANTTVVDYNSHSKGSTVDALCISSIIIDVNGNRYNGQAEDEDIEISALKAFIDAVNNAYIETNFKV